MHAHSGRPTTSRRMTSLRRASGSTTSTILRDTRSRIRRRRATSTARRERRSTSTSGPTSATTSGAYDAAGATTREGRPSSLPRPCGWSGIHVRPHLRRNPGRARFATGPSRSTRRCCSHSDWPGWLWLLGVSRRSRLRCSCTRHSRRWCSSVRRAIACRTTFSLRCWRQQRSTGRTFTAPGGGIGGSERHLLTLLPALAKRGIDVSFLGLDDPSRAPDPFYEALAVPFERVPAPRDVDPLLAARVRRATRKADLVHTHLVHADVYGAVGAHRLVSTKHNDDPFRAGLFRFVERALARRAVRIVAITHALARFQVESVGLPAEKVEVIHYGLDNLPAAWGANPPDDLPHDAHVLLAVCRLEPQKGVDVAVRAL